MSTLGTMRPTIWDVAKATDPNGNIAKVAKILMQYNDILDDIPWYEGNLATGNLTTIQTSLASPSLRALNNGVVPTKSTTGQINDACSILENRTQIDCNVANLNGNVAQFRALQDEMMIQGFGNSLAEHIVYGSSADNPLEFNGLASRYFSLGSTYTTSSQILDAGGTGSDNTSIWLVNWGPGRVHGIYPKGSRAGLQIEDRGIQDVILNTTTQSTMRAYVTWMQWLCGLAVADYRSVVRISNVDVSNLLTASDSSDTSANIMKFMSRALDLLPPDQGGTPVFYMNNTVRSMLRIKQIDKGNAFLQVGDIAGPNQIMRRGQLSFYGIPCRRIDSILSTETRITSSLSGT